MSKQKISIIIPTYNAELCLGHCLNSILHNQHNPDNEIVLVVDGTYEIMKDTINHYLDKLNMKVIPFEENQGLAMGMNIGVLNASNEHFLLINDDNVCPKDFDKKLLEDIRWFGDDPVLITPNQIEPVPSIFKPFIIHDFGNPQTFDLNTFNEQEPNYRNGKTSIGWTFPLFTTKEAFWTVGGFDLLYDSAHVIDWEFFIKCERAGIDSIRTFSSNFYHFGSQSARTPESYDKEKTAHEYFYMKWGFPAYNKLLQNQ